MTSLLPQAPGPRSVTHLFSLPDELLLDIFAAVKIHRPTNNSRHPDFASSSSDIAAVRLVCRRFAAISSHLLVHYVRLNGISSQSLERIEAISCHPLIKKGVRIVRFEACGYVPALAQDIEEFAKWAAERVLNNAISYRRDFEDGLKTSASMGDSHADDTTRKRGEVAGVLKKVKAVLDTWISFESGEHVHQEPSGSSSDVGGMDQEHHISDAPSLYDRQHNIRLLRVAHELYRQRYEDQERLSKDKAFVERFSKAMSRMPRAKYLEIQDLHREPKTYFTSCAGAQKTRFPRVENGHQLAGLFAADFLAEAMPWQDMADDGTRTKLGGLGLTLPMVLYNAGCRLDRIVVHSTACADDYYSLIHKSFSNSSFADLGYAIQDMGLRSFSFIQRDRSTCQHGPLATAEDIEAFQKYLAAMTRSSRLERLRMEFDGGRVSGGPDQLHGLDFASVVSPSIIQSRRSLKDIHVTGLPLDLGDLERLWEELKAYDMSVAFFTLKRMQLVSGKWSEALDMLREMCIEIKEVLEPTGAEYGCVFTQMSAWYERSFGEDSRHGVLVDQYINGVSEQNPMRGAGSPTN